jgi:hypothetical protein
LKLMRHETSPNKIDGSADPSQELVSLLCEFAGTDPSRALSLNQA